VADALEDLEPAVRQLAMRLLGVGDGDDRIAVAPMKRSAPGSAAARRIGLTSGPRPPLETRTRRSTISGNW